MNDSCSTQGCGVRATPLHLAPDRTGLMRMLCQRCVQVEAIAIAERDGYTEYTTSSGARVSVSIPKHDLTCPHCAADLRRLRSEFDRAREDLAFAQEELRSLRMSHAVTSERLRQALLDTWPCSRCGPASHDPTIVTGSKPTGEPE